MCNLKHKAVKVTFKKTLNQAMHVMECPICKTVVASASERSFLPEFATCDGINELPSFKLPKSLKIELKKYIPTTLGVGSVVNHKRFGKGTILTEDEKRVDIDFVDQGKKNLLKQFANLQVVKDA